MAHLNDVKRGRVYIPRHKWIASLSRASLTPEIFEIEQVDDADWRCAEQFWISYFRSIGCDLLNATSGGDGLCSYRHTEETRLKQSKAARIRYLKDSERTKTGLAVRRAFSALGTRETLRKLASKRLHRYPHHLVEFAKSEMGRKRVSLLMTWKPKSEETIRKLSEARIGKKRSIESRLKQAATRRGQKHSEETKKKISEARRRQIGDR